MKVTELRINNLVEWEGNIHPIGTIFHDGKINLRRDGNSAMDGASIEKIIPIPLTEEWLVKFGFEKDSKDNNVFFAPDDISMQITMKEGYYGVRFSLDESVEGMFNMFDSDVIAVIQYVHQLQNLYFALTGEELTIK